MLPWATSTTYRWQPRSHAVVHGHLQQFNAPELSIHVPWLFIDVNKLPFEVPIVSLHTRILSYRILSCLCLSVCIVQVELCRGIWLFLHREGYHFESNWSLWNSMQNATSSLSMTVFALRHSHQALMIDRTWDESLLAAIVDHHG